MVLHEFRELCCRYQKRYKNQRSFKSLRMAKNSSGELEPVFYVGVPGLMVAITFSFVTIATVYILYLPFYWYVWVPYIVFVIFLFRISMKLDKVRQIRYMVFYMLDLALKKMEEGEAASAENRDEHRKKALYWLERADQWVDEPQLKSQIEALNK